MLCRRARALPLVIIAIAIVAPLHAMACARETSAPSPLALPPEGGPGAGAANASGSSGAPLATSVVSGPPAFASASALGDALVAKSSRSANAGPTADECRALYATAQRAAGDSWKRASKSCATADDCMLVSKRGCLSDCSGFPIAKRSFAAWKREHEQLEATTCRMYWDGGCNAKVPMPAPTCPTYRTACQDGKCAVAN